MGISTSIRITNGDVFIFSEGGKGIVGSEWEMWLVSRKWRASSPWFAMDTVWRSRRSCLARTVWFTRLSSTTGRGVSGVVQIRVGGIVGTYLEC